MGVAAAVLVRHRSCRCHSTTYFQHKNEACISNICFHTSINSLLQTILLLYFVIEDHDTLFIMSEAVHFIGIGFLAYKLLRKKNVGGVLELNLVHFTRPFNTLYPSFSYRSSFAQMVHPSCGKQLTFWCTQTIFSICIPIAASTSQPTTANDL
jgi:hypothetical protein